VPASDLRFPYMFFARRSGGRAPCSLVASGMPPADARLFEPELPDLDFAGKEALPLLEERLAAHLGLDREQVLVTVGASAAMLVTGLALYRGARVAVERPCYEPLAALPEVCGGELRPFDRRADERYAVDPDRVRRALGRGNGPGHVVLSTPHNPSGARSGPEELATLAELAAGHGGFLISNEVYLEFVPRAERRSAVHLAPAAIALGSLTKAYGLGALRIGWIALGERARALRARFEDASYLATVDPPTPALRLGARALERIDALRAPYERLRALNRPLFARWLAETPGVEALVPEHGLIAFPRLEGIADTHAFQRFAAREHGVDVVPGEYFGAGGHVRLGYGVEPEVLRGGLERLGRALAAARAGGSG
jgi:aspartate/methionine/tyrosine aminotransferase